MPNDETKRVTCWIGEDAPAAHYLAGIEQRRTEFDYLFLGVVEVRNFQIQMELLGTSRVRPLRGRVVFHTLEGEHQTALCMDGRPGFVECPPRIGFVHHAIEKRRVEQRKLNDIATVQDHTLQLTDHSGSVDQN